MADQRLDWRLVVVLIVASVVFVAAMLTVRRWQANTQPRQATTAMPPVTR